jgi:hypothetical protein
VGDLSQSSARRTRTSSFWQNETFLHARGRTTSGRDSGPGLWGGVGLRHDFMVGGGTNVVESSSTSTLSLATSETLKCGVSQGRPSRLAFHVARRGRSGEALQEQFSGM